MYETVKKIHKNVENIKTFRKRNVIIRRGERELRHNCVQRIYRNGLTKGEKVGRVGGYTLDTTIK